MTSGDEPIRWEPEGGYDLRREGCLFWCEEDHLAVLAMLLEHVVVDRDVRLGDPAAWRAAVAGLGADHPRGD